MAKNDNPKNVRCSFCGKSQDSVKKIVAGPGVFICDECVDLCTSIIEAEKYEEDEQSQIDEELKEIYNLISYVPKNINYIAMKSKCGISNVNQKLIILELKGYIKSLPGNNYVRC